MWYYFEGTVGEIFESREKVGQTLEESRKTFISGLAVCLSPCPCLFSLKFSTPPQTSPLTQHGSSGIPFPSLSPHFSQSFSATSLSLPNEDPDIKISQCLANLTYTWCFSTLKSNGNQEYPVECCQLWKLQKYCFSPRRSQLSSWFNSFPISIWLSTQRHGQEAKLQTWTWIWNHLILWYRAYYYWPYNTIRVHTIPGGCLVLSPAVSSTLPSIGREQWVQWCKVFQIQLFSWCICLHFLCVTYSQCVGHARCMECPSYPDCVGSFR